MKLPRRYAAVLGLVLAGAAITLSADGQMPVDRARADYDRATALFADARYDAAYDAYNRALASSDGELSTLARKGKIRSALRLSGFRAARGEAEVLRVQAPNDVEAMTLLADSLWSAGLFDEAEAGYQAALNRDPKSARAI